MNGERMHAAGEFRRQDRINHAVALDPALPPEGFRHDIYPEMSFPAGPVAGMAFVLVGLVNHGQAFRRESLDQLSCDKLLGSHGIGLARAMRRGQS